MLQNTSDVLTAVSIVLTAYSIFITYKTLSRRRRSKEASIWYQYIGARSLEFFSDKRKIAGILLTVIAALLWSISNVSLRFLTLKGDDSIFIIAAMNLIGAISCFVVAAVFGGTKFKAKMPSFSKMDLALIVGGNAINALAFVFALKFISSSQLIILNKTNPLFLAMILYLFTNEKLSLAGMAAIVSTVCGIYVLVGGPSFEISLADGGLAGSALALVAGLAFAIFTFGLYQTSGHDKRTSMADKLWYMGWILLYSYLILVTVAFFFGYKFPNDVESWLWIGINGVRMAVVYLIYQQAIRLTDPILVSVVVSLEVVFTIILERQWLATSVTTNVILGAVLILGAIWSLILDRRASEQRVTTI